MGSMMMDNIRSLMNEYLIQKSEESVDSIPTKTAPINIMFLEGQIRGSPFPALVLLTPSYRASRIESI